MGKTQEGERHKSVNQHTSRNHSEALYREMRKEKLNTKVHVFLDSK